ncbi:MAG: type IA DNA topoisomerase [Lachnospiraceae bacterium]|nr:type IA DNA topoisomerase [Lachnospiraceae bacterium]
MGKSLFISEKPSVAQEFAKVLKINNSKRNDGYLESETCIVTWCVGHLVTMSYPESYDPALKKWSLTTLPFLPDTFLYEVIPNVKKQFNIVAGLLNRDDVDKIYVCTDSGREGEYIYRLVDSMAKVKPGKEKRRVWIDSQTEEEILRGIKEAKLLSEYDNLASSAYLRAKEDYLMGINFSRVLTLKYGNSVTNYLGSKWSAISVGRVMTCVLGMVVKREREIRDFVETPYYRVLGKFDLGGKDMEGEWRAVKGSAYFESPLLYKENGFKKKEDAEKLCSDIKSEFDEVTVTKAEKKKEVKNAPLLYNLAELQNDCSKMFKISPDETLKCVQELYEKKLCTYPRTDARVLSTAVAKEINKNLSGLTKYNVDGLDKVAGAILNKGTYKDVAKTKYTNDKQITDHYAIIPTGQGLNTLSSLSPLLQSVYQVIVRRFLCIFLKSAVYEKINVVSVAGKESFFSSFKILVEQGYLAVASKASDDKDNKEDTFDKDLVAAAGELKKGSTLKISSLNVKEGKTSPPKRYTSGSMILAMENAGQLIEDEELREQIKGSGIGTSATRAEILNKLVKIAYLKLNKKTQVITPTQLGEMVYEVVFYSIKSLLDPTLTASWEKGLSYVAEGTIKEDEYMVKLENFVKSKTEFVKGQRNENAFKGIFDKISVNYK